MPRIEHQHDQLALIDRVDHPVVADPDPQHAVGTRERNADVVRTLLSGQQGPVRDAVLLNAAAALVAAEPGEASLDRQLIAAIERAAAAVDSGAAAAVLERWVSTSQALATT